MGVFQSSESEPTDELSIVIIDNDPKQIFTKISSSALIHIISHTH